MFTTIVALLVGFSAHATQNLNCREVSDKGKVLKNGISVKVTLNNENGPVEGITASLKTEGIFKPKVKWGKGQSWKSEQLAKMYEYQHGSKPTVVIFFEDSEQKDFNYTLYINNEDIGKNAKTITSYLWTDFDHPEGGGYPYDLLCSSRVR